MSVVQILCGDVREQLRTLPDASVHCVVTSPPYWGLRDYGHAGQIGLEPTPDAYVETLVAVFAEVWRVLRDDGTCWLNLGDSYATRWGSRRDQGRAGLADNERTRGGAAPAGTKEKDLVGIPWRVAFALRDAGWYLRADTIWAKACSGQRDYLAQVAQTALDVGIDPLQVQALMAALDLPVGTTMPESVIDRPTKAHEYVFLLTKSAEYFYDAEAVKEEQVKPPQTWLGNAKRRKAEAVGPMRRGEEGFNHQWQRDGRLWGSGRRNLRSVWAINPKPYKGAHFATFPPELARTCILAGSSPTACGDCGAPYTRVIRRGAPNDAQRAASGADASGTYNGVAQKDYAEGRAQDPSATKARILEGMVARETVGWQPTCRCGAPPAAVPLSPKHTDPPEAWAAWEERRAAMAQFVAARKVVPCRVLDPFAGSGTTLAVAQELGRAATGIELNPEYLALIKERVGDV